MSDRFVAGNDKAPEVTLDYLIATTRVNPRPQAPKADTGDENSTIARLQPTSREGIMDGLPQNGLISLRYSLPPIWCYIAQAVHVNVTRTSRLLRQIAAGLLSRTVLAGGTKGVTIGGCRTDWKKCLSRPTSRQARSVQRPILERKRTACGATQERVIGMRCCWLNDICCFPASKSLGNGRSCRRFAGAESTWGHGPHRPANCPRPNTRGG